jgi:hypothetical protein
MDTITAAPVPDDTTQSPPKTKNTRNPQQRRKGNPNLNGKKSLDRRRNLFDDNEAEAWINACNSIDWVPEYKNEQNQNASYQSVSESQRTMLRQNLYKLFFTKNRLNYRSSYR